MVCFFKSSYFILVLSISVWCHCSNAESFIGLLKKLKSRLKDFIINFEHFQDTSVGTVVYDGNIVYSGNKTKFRIENINDRHLIQTLEGSDIDFTEFKQPLNYYLLRLGSVNRSWSVEMFENFTTIIDNSGIRNNKLRTLFGFTLAPVSPIQVESFPYLKAIVRDLKQYLVFKGMDRVPIGIEVNPGDTIFIQDNIYDYFHCENNYSPNFYSINNKIIEFNSFNRTSYLSNITTLNTEKSCADVKVDGINTRFLPYPPRSSRCDCIMSMLQCVINQKSDLTYTDENTVMNNSICSEVYCGQIMDNPTKGKYGVFTSCNNIQKYSIAFNLFYTFKENDEKSCNFDGKAKLLNKGTSIEDYMKLSGFDGKQCGEEVEENWKRYLTGIPKKDGDLCKPTLHKVYNYDSEQNYEDNMKNSLARVKVQWFSILLWSFLITLMF